MSKNDAYRFPSWDAADETLRRIRELIQADQGDFFKAEVDATLQAISPLVIGTARKMLDSRGRQHRYVDAEDMAQEWQIIVLRGGLDGWRDGPLRKYAVGILRNLCRNTSRRKFRQESNQLSETFVQSSDRFNPYREDLSNEAIQKVRLAVEALSSTVRAVMEQQYLWGMSVKESAAAEGISKKAVENLRYRGREALQRHLAEFREEYGKRNSLKRRRRRRSRWPGE